MGARVATALPDWSLVEELFAAGYRRVGGIDEVGRGAWAGPVAVGVVVVEAGCAAAAPAGVRDSKLLVESARERLYDPLAAWCPAYAVGEASPRECDELGMTAAQRLAARRALRRLALRPDVLVVDGKWDYTGDERARAVIGADATCFPVAAASVLAKVSRDRKMVGHALRYPAYAFERNKGYASAEHRAAVARHGLTALHRLSWSVVYSEPSATAASRAGDLEET
jgi:ribonuclease HII